MTNPTIVSPVKMEYGWNFSISGLEIMMKSGLGKIFLKFLHAITMLSLLLNFWSKFSNKNNMVSAWRNFKNVFPRHFLARNAKISTIFYFNRRHQSWICHILCVKWFGQFWQISRISCYVLGANVTWGIGGTNYPHKFCHCISLVYDFELISHFFFKKQFFP